MMKSIIKSIKNHFGSWSQKSITSLIQTFTISMLMLFIAVACGKDEEAKIIPRPTVVSTNVADGATEVDLQTEIKVNFSEAMDASTITNNSFFLKKGTVTVAGSVQYSEKLASFRPNDELEPYTNYTFTITTEARSALGETLEQDIVWSFTTGAAPDVIAPGIDKTTPLDAETYVAGNSVIIVKFDEEMDAATINNTTFLVKNGTETVPGSVSLDRYVATFTPNEELAAGTTYTCVVSTEATDLAGNALSEEYVWNFTTTPAIISFSEGILPIFTNHSCISCHRGSQAPDLRSDYAYAGLTEGAFVNTEKPEESRIIKQLSGNHNGYISDKEENLILEWIRQGAQDN